LRERTREKEGNAKAQSRREEDEKDSVVACRGRGILFMMLHGRDARATPIRTQGGEGRDLRHPPGSSLGNTPPAPSERKVARVSLKWSHTPVNGPVGVLVSFVIR